jgi:GNAT superfamily N-acetyltransferase
MKGLALIPYSDRQVIHQFYKSQREKIKVQKNDLCYLLIDGEDQNIPMAGVKFSRLPDGSWLLRNMLVAVAHRGKGVGHQFLTLLSPILEELHCSSNGVACFPWRDLSGFYTQHGFERIEDSPEGNEFDRALPEQHLSHEAFSRYQAYKRRGLDITLCVWRP